ncbi:MULTISPECIES: transferase spermidine synthase [unclassified Janthinobacterium]|uniref:spermine/spermidine synthase domain-containing protein n=1 Tax=unclassified Janthinobacterium TaxID=2610881 RepID=UPI0008F4F603|nr:MULTISPECIES: transferase spermidine synthase [unclassified Janthinobacterium]APA69047.1 transferase spermidine synthase [Janthinobacterium sp. 1_2014MBL_MicDiv]MDN2712157.1 transferase spermidine synthase [Janthinobacterium sp. SUN118]
MSESKFTTLRAPQVHTCGDRRRLEFEPGMIQSEMLLSRPDHLLLRYARAMMCFTLFVPRPRHILMVGLGGGSLLKFCHRHLPHARITVLELRADVIALREQFMLPPDDARLRIIETDAVSYIRQHPGCADVLLLDGYDETGLPPALGSARFYADCLRALLPGGVLVANLFSYDRQYPAMLERLMLTFRGAVCSFDGIAGNNRIIFAARPDKLGAGRALRVVRLARWRRACGMGFLNRLLPAWQLWRLRRQADAGTGAGSDR